MVYLKRNGAGKGVFVHRLVCEAFHGPPKPGQQTRHLDSDSSNARADNLVWGSQSENEADKITVGRSNRGNERSGTVKLSPLDVLDIRNLLRRTTLPHRDIARLFMVGEGAVAHVAKGTTWRWLPGAGGSGPCRRHERPNGRMFSDDQVRVIRRRYAAGETQSAMAREFGIGQPVISAIILRVTYREVA